MDFDAENRYLDQAEGALPSAGGGRRESETSFLQRLLRELGDPGSALGRSPAELFRAALYNQPLMYNARDVLEVLARPSQRPEGALRAGDWILRAVPGTGDVGHVSVLASADLLTPSDLESEGVAAESQQPGQYGVVVEAGAFPHRRSRRFARRVLDSRGRVPPHTVILRPQYPRAGAMSDVPPDEPEPERRFDAEEPATVDEAATQALSVLVVDESGQLLVKGEYAVHQGGRSERGDFAKDGNGLALFKTIDAAQAFTFEVRDRVCAIGEGAFIDPDDPAIEYGGTWFDWTLVRDNKSPQTAFWPHYLAELKADGSRRSVDRFWQHEHIVRRPIRAIGAAGGGSKPVKICAVPAQIRTGPIVRYTDHQRASVWLEAATPSLVKLRVKRAGGREGEKTAYASTVRVGGRYFAIVEVDGLDPDTFYQYTLELAPLPATGAIPVDAKDFDGVFPAITPDVRRAMRQQLCEASVEQIEWLSFRTLRPRYDKSLRFATGSCRWYPGDVISGDEEEPKEAKDWGPDMLDHLGEWLRKTPRPQWPHFQFYGGDQIYADEVGNGHHKELIRARFASRVPGPKDPNASVADRLIDGAWAGRFSHRLKPADAPIPSVRSNVDAGLAKLKAMYTEHPVLRLVAKGRVTQKQLLERYQTLLTRRRDVQRASSEAEDERKARMAIELLPQLKQLLVTVEPFRVYRRYWDAVPRSGASSRPAYRYRSCNFLLWQLPDAETDLPTLQDQTAGDVGVRGAGGGGHDSADHGRHVADFAEYAFLYERAWTTTRNVRVLLGNVPTFLMLDDHEVTDDWNFDAAWVRMVHSQRDHYRMWPKTITDALCAYWIYQGLGNKARAHWERDRDPRTEVLDRAHRAGIDALPELRKCIYRAVMAASPTNAEAPFQTGTSLKWHYQLPFQPPFLVPDCRTRRCLVPGDEKMKQIDHERKPPQSETIDAEQIKWLREALNGCETPVAFIAPSTPLLMQKAVMKIMSQPESYAKAWARESEGETKIGLAHALLAGSASLELIRTFRRVKDLEHMIRDKSWRDLWALVETMHRKPSPLKTLVLVSGDVHHSYCMTGNLSSHGRPFPELLQITSSGLHTTIRRHTTEAIGEALSDLSFNFAQRHLVPGFMSKAGSRRRELALYQNAVAIVDVSLGADVEVRVIHLAGDDETRGVDKYVYQYTSGPSYIKMGEPANTPYRLGAPAETAEGLSDGVAEPRAVIDEAALDLPEDESVASEDRSVDPDQSIGVDDVPAAAWQVEDEGFEDFDQFAEDDPVGGSGGPAVVPATPATIGFEFDLNIGLSRDIFTARAADMPHGAAFPGPGDRITDHREDDGTGKLIDGFQVKADGPRLEIATLPIKIDDDATFLAVVRNVIAFARELETERGKVTPDRSLSVTGIAGHPVRFTHARTVVSNVPLVIATRGSQSGRSWPSDRGVWAAPQATITILLEHVGELIDTIAKSAGTGLGKALSGGASLRLGVRSDIVVKAKARVLADRAKKIGTALSDKSQVTAGDYSPRLAGLLMLMTSYMLSGEMVDSDDYELFAKAYLAINVKAPFRDIFREALSAREQLVFKELYFNNRASFFALAKDGATTHDENSELFPAKVRGPDLDRFHLRRLTWGQLLGNTVNDIPLKVTRANSVAKKHHALGDEVLWAPISKIIPFATTRPRVALELRRIGFAAHPVKFWEPLMNTVRALTKKL